MSAFNNATKFFHACEGLEGPSGTAPYVAEGASFECQAQALSGIETVQDYAGWLAGLGTTALAGARYKLHSSAWDAESNCALFFSTFIAAHTGDGGPVAPTGKETNSHYVYVIKMNDAGKVAHVTKIWNSSWALRELVWAQS